MASEPKDVLIDISIESHGFNLSTITDATVGDICRFDLRYCDLTRKSQLKVSTRDLEHKDFSLKSTFAFDLFDENDVLKQGKFKFPITEKCTNERLLQLEATMKRFEEDCEFRLVPWMDEIAVELVQQKRMEAVQVGGIYLEIELQRFDHLVLFSSEQAGLKSTLQIQYSKMSFLPPIDHATETELEILIKRRPFMSKLVSDERILIWRHRERLVHRPEALLMFLKSVDWIDEEEVNIVQELLERWAPLGPGNLLELFAIRQPLEESHQRVLWDLVYRPNFLRSIDAFKFLLPQLIQILLNLVELKGNSADFYPDISSNDAVNFFVGFLVKLAVDDIYTGTHLFWHLRVASRAFQARSSVGENVFGKVQGMFLGSLSQLGPSGVAISESFYQQSELFGKMETLMKLVKKMKGSRELKQSTIIEYLDSPSNGFMSFKAFPLPLNPNIIISGVLGDRSVLFKSNALPVKLHFVATENSKPDDIRIYPVIFKEGDDLRQDQLVLEIVSLIDRIWKRNRLDLRLTIYKVLATTVNTGLVQYIPSLPLSTILAENNGNLRAYLSSLSCSKGVPSCGNTSEFDALLIDPHIHDNYLRSSAGYSVITYVLGVGDRHLENLLLTESGHLFHVDFTYAFGRDPKPLAPPMKLCKEMVEAMSAVPIDFSQHSFPLEYRKFKRLCFTAFSLLRRNARELLTAISLLSYSGTADLAPMATAADIAKIQHRTSEAGLQVPKAVLFVQERLMLEMSEEEALSHFDRLIDDSVTALFPQVLETIHKWAQYWRN